jgi:hypothetical protein
MQKETLKEVIRRAVAGYRQTIVDEVIAHPEKSYDVIAKEFNVTANYVYMLSRKAGVRRKVAQDQEVLNG